MRGLFFSMTTMNRITIGIKTRRIFLYISNRHILSIPRPQLTKKILRQIADHQTFIIGAIGIIEIDIWLLLVANYPITRQLPISFLELNMLWHADIPFISDHIRCRPGVSIKFLDIQNPRAISVGCTISKSLDVWLIESWHDVAVDLHPTFMDWRDGRMLGMARIEILYERAQRALRFWRVTSIAV